VIFSDIVPKTGLSGERSKRMKSLIGKEGLERLKRNR